MKKFYSFAIVFLLVVFLPSCQTNIENKLIDQTCSPPCWRGISMGTNKQKTIETLNQMIDIDQDSIKVEKTDRDYMQYVIYWNFKNNQDLGNIIINNDAVSAFDFSLNRGTPLKDAIKIYGKPDYVIINKMIFEQVFLEVYLIYEKGVCIEYQPSIWPFTDITTYKIKPGDLIENIYYSDPTIKDWPIGMYFIGFSNENYLEYRSPWNGYSSYPVYRSMP
jgi:hypothetical protein